jgi:hypothetical protein
LYSPYNIGGLDRRGIHGSLLFFLRGRRHKLLFFYVGGIGGRPKGNLIFIVGRIVRRVMV